MSFLLIQQIAAINRILSFLLILIVVFIYMGFLKFNTYFVINHPDSKKSFTKEFISAILLAVSIIAFIQPAGSQIPFYYENIDPGSLAFFLLLPFILLLKLRGNEIAQITILLFLLIPFGKFIGMDGAAETVSITTFLCLGLLAVKRI